MSVPGLAQAGATITARILSAPEMTHADSLMSVEDYSQVVADSLAEAGNPLIYAAGMATFTAALLQVAAKRSGKTPLELVNEVSSAFITDGNL